MSIENLFGDDFPLNEEDTSKLLQKAKEPKKAKVKKTMDPRLALQEKLLVIEQDVNRILGQHKDNTIVIRDRQGYLDYIGSCIKNGICAVDTETNNSTEPITCKLMGLCLYTPNQKQAYIPVNHVDINTRERLPNQLSEEGIAEGLRMLVDAKTKLLYHNATFDMSVLQCQCGVELPVYWDTRVASRVLDENDSAKSRSNLKFQYMEHLDPSHGKYDIEGLFQGLEYSIIDPNLFDLYAATDSFMTYRLYDWQLSQYQLPENSRLQKLLLDVEFEEIPVVKDMELAGVSIDKEYWQRLKAKYDNQLVDIDKRVAAELAKLKPTIDAWRLTSEANKKAKKADGNLKKSLSEQLEEPVNLGSPSQFAILLYDILKMPVVDRKSPRGTGEEIIEELHKRTGMPLLKLLLERRACTKILSAYIDNIPPLLDVWGDGKIRVGFDQMGTDTGRFTSGGTLRLMRDGRHIEIPKVNLQTIPSHNKEIRMLYKASEGHVIVGSDFSAQEPRLTAFMSQDDAMLQAYKDGKDLYAVIASMSFGKPYEECLEFNPITGAKQVEGKERRSQAKSILLGLLYGRGAASIGEQIGKSKEEAQEIINKFFKAFPKVQKWIEGTHEKARKCGYVEDWYGRQRKLPAINLPEYEFENMAEQSESDANFNPFFGCSNRADKGFESKVKLYEGKLKRARWGRDVKAIIADAEANHVRIKDNHSLIAKAERESVNAIIQGGAATLTKMAMINIHKDPELKRMGFKLLSTIHDEVFGECPEEYGEECSKRLSQVMVDTAKPYMNVPQKCDPYMVKSWYQDEYKAELLKEMSKLTAKSNQSPMSRDEAFEHIVGEHPESTREFLKELLTE